MSQRLDRQVKVRFDTPTYARILSESEVNGVSAAETVRRVVEEFYQQQSARMGAAVVEDTLRRVIEPHIDQLAALITYAGVSAGTSAWLAKALMNLLTQVDSDEAWDQAVARAKVGLRRSLKGTGDIDDEEY